MSAAAEAAGTTAVRIAPSVPVLELDRVSTEYPGSPPVRALEDVSVAVAAGGRTVWVGQVHAAAPDGHLGPAQRRDGTDHRPGRGPDERPGAVGAAGAAD